MAPVRNFLKATKAKGGWFSTIQTKRRFLRIFLFFLFLILVDSYRDAFLKCESDMYRVDTLFAMHAARALCAPFVAQR